MVGLGWFGQIAVLPAFEHATENSELAALFSSDREKLEKKGDELGVEGRYSYEDLERGIEEQELDALYIVLPNHLHRRFTERAAAAGVHVLCEKPMAVTEDDCRAMIRACDEAGVKLMIAYRLHFERAHMRAVEIVRSGKLGEPRLFEAVFSNPVTDRDNIRLGPIAKGGGTLYDIGIYCLNASRYLFGAEPIEVSAFSASSEDPRFADCDEMTTAILRFPENRLATFASSFGAADNDHLTVYGSDGWLRIEPGFGHTGPLVHELQVDGRRERQEYVKRDQIAPEILYFSDCILEDREPEPSGAEGMADVRVIEALYRSAAEGRAIALEPVDVGERPDLDQERRRQPVDEQELVNAEAP